MNIVTDIHFVGERKTFQYLVKAKLLMKSYIIFVALYAFGLESYAQAPSQSVASPEWSTVNDELRSIQQSFSRKTDSITHAYQSPLQRLDSARSSLKGKLDTLHSNNASKVRHAIDSVNELQRKTIARLNDEIGSLKNKTIDKLNQKAKEVGLPPDVMEKISSLTADIEKFSLPTGNLDLAHITSTDFLPGELNNLNLNATVPQLTNGSDLKSLTGNVAGDLQVPTELSTHSVEIQQLVKGEPGAINGLASTAEEKAAELSGLKDVQKEAGVLNEYKEELAVLKNPVAMKEQGVEQLQQVAMDHFAGKGQILQEAMDKMSKYKEKYASLTSLTDVPVKRPNEMRSKPLIERIVPAFMIQIQKEGNDLLLDLNPYVGYRFNGKLTAGPGWNQRFAYDTRANSYNSKPMIFGPRIFAEYKLWKGFFPRVEVEVMNAYVSPLTKPATIDQGSREWVWGVFVGIKKEYKFLKTVKGTALIMTRLFDPNHKSPYADVINARFGFEFPMKKKVKNP